MGRSPGILLAVTGLTFLGILAGSVIETRRAEERPFVALRDSAGARFGPLYALPPGT